MALRMQTSVPEVMNIEEEPDYIYQMWPDAMTPGTFAANCILPGGWRKKACASSSFYHMGWDQHFDLPVAIQKHTKDVDQGIGSSPGNGPQTAGMLEDTSSSGAVSSGTIIPRYSDGHQLYQDHHPRCFSIWMAGAA